MNLPIGFEIPALNSKTFPILIAVVPVALLLAYRVLTLPGWKGARSTLKAYAPAALSLVIAGGALYVIFFGGYSSDEQKWAFGAIGVVLGFWLKP